MAKSLSDQIREAVHQSELSHYRISKSASIDKGSLSKFLSGKRGLSLPALEKVADLLGLEIVVRPKKTRKEG